MATYEFLVCQNVECRLRFPAAAGDPRAATCPRCRGAVVAAAHAAEHMETAVHAPTPIRPPIAALLDNIRSVHNVGSMFRAADGAGVAHLHLCGITATPAHPKLAKAALGAQEKVAWSYAANGVETAVALKAQGRQLWAIEAAIAARPLFGSPVPWSNAPVVVVVGNEKAGVDPGILAHCDQVFCLPMGGFKQSLNVAVAFGIAVYYLTYAA